MKEVGIEIVKSLFKIIITVVMISLVLVTFALTLLCLLIASPLFLFVDIDIFGPIRWECEIIEKILKS